MDIQRAHREFELFLDKVDSQATPDFLPEERDIFLHEAELRLVNQTYGGNNIYKKGFQENQKRTDDINTLVKSGYLKPIKLSDTLIKFELTSIYKNDDFSDVPRTDYLYFIRCKTHVSSSTITSAKTDPFLAQLDDVSRILADPYNSPTIARPIISFAEGSLYVHKTASFEVPCVELTYIKYPRKVDYRGNISSELPEHKQREAIQLAVRIALGAIESPRIEEQSQQLSTLE
jgi:hypothetical protein